MNKANKILAVVFGSAIAIAFVAGAVVSANAAGYVFTRNLTVGSMGADVIELQKVLNSNPATVVALTGVGSAGMESSYFGGLTKTAVVKFQLSKGISGTGYVGPLTLAALNAVPAVVVPTTPSTPSTTLKGGAGELTINQTSTGVKNSLKEGESDVKVIGIKAEADGSDIRVTSIKVTLENASSTDGTSEKLSNYLDEVSVFLGSKKVGSADVSDFSKTSGTPDSFSKTISLKDAIVKDGDEEKFYVAVSANSNIDTEDLVADLSIDIDTVRYEDATGIVLTENPTLTVEEFSFDNVSADDQIDAKSSSANPENETVKVDANNTSDTFTSLVFKLDVDEDSSDVSITSLPVTLTVAAAGTTTDSIEDIIENVVVTIDGEKYDADLTTDSVENGSSTAVYTVEFDSEEVVIEAGDVVDVKVALTFKEQDGNYDNNTTVVASVTPANIDAETSEDDITVGGSTKTGATLTLNVSAAAISNTRWAVSNTGTIVDFFFTVEAGDNDFDVLSSSIASSTAGTATTSVGTLTKYSGDASTISGGFTVAEGDTATFRIRYNIGGSNGQWKEITITSVAGNDIADDKETSPTATINISN